MKEEHRGNFSFPAHLCVKVKFFELVSRDKFLLTDTREYAQKVQGLKVMALESEFRNGFGAALYVHFLCVKKFRDLACIG